MPGIGVPPLAAFGASLVAHLATFATFLCVAYAFRASVAALDFFAIMPIERTISSLPISFAGVGTREKIFQVMLHRALSASPGSGRGLIGIDWFSRHARLLRAGRDRLFLLQTERRRPAT